MTKVSIFRTVIFLILFVSAPVLWSNPFMGKEDSPAPTAPGTGVIGGTGPFSELQFTFRDGAASYLNRISGAPSFGDIAGFLAVCFLYGILHGAGPGHRKTIVFSIFLARRSPRWYEPAGIGFLSSTLHAGAAVAVIAIYSLIEKGISSLSSTSSASIYLDGITLGVLVFLSFVLILRKIIEMIRGGHSHMEPGRKNLYSLIIIASIIPCPGATMLLLLALYLDLIFFGILGVTAMSLGMGVLVSAVGYLAVAGRTGLFSRLKRNEHRVQLAADLFEFLSYTLIFLFCLIMAWPFFVSIFQNHPSV
ncbi:MAG: hypothetical protein PQJ50_12660 [Spirochaetales bacterium]|nr:hypothetical protein [Spirochaetales bacterium]